MLRVQHGIRLHPAVPVLFVCLFFTYLQWSINLQPTLEFQFHFLTRLISLYLTLQIKTALASNPFGNMGFVFNRNIFMSPLLCMHLSKQSVFFFQSALARLRPDPWPERLEAGERCLEWKNHLAADGGLVLLPPDLDRGGKRNRIPETFESS